MTDTTLSNQETELFHRALDSLKLEYPASVIPINIGKSTSLVVKLDFILRSVILKVTYGSRAVERAKKEIELLSRPDPLLTQFMPSVIASSCEGDMAFLALEEYNVIDSPEDLNHEDWLAIATALGTIHSAAVPASDLLRSHAGPTNAQLRVSEEHWRKRGVSARVTAGAVEVIGNHLQEVPADKVFCHGDCHVENIVRDFDGSFRWVDWQESLVGDGFADLAFLWQRAEFANAKPPREAMTRAYEQARGLPAHSGDRDLHQAELRLLFHAWAEHLPYENSPEVTAMTNHLHELVESLR